MQCTAVAWRLQRRLAAWIIAYCLMRWSFYTMHPARMHAQNAVDTTRIPKYTIYRVRMFIFMQSAAAPPTRIAILWRLRCLALAFINGHVCMLWLAQNRRPGRRIVYTTHVRLFERYINCCLYRIYTMYMCYMASLTAHK